MNLFICWSGRRGELAANALAEWMKKAFGGLVQPQVSSGLEKGVRWEEGLTKFLGEAHAGLVLVTPEALQSSWVSYEAGVLSRAVAVEGGRAMNAGAGSGRLFTLLWGVRDAEINRPLAAFQSTQATDESDFCRLVDSLLTLARRVESAGDVKCSAAMPDKWPELWQELRDLLAAIPAATLPEICPEFEKLFHRKTFQEPADQCVDQRWLDRFEGACETLHAIAERKPSIERACRGYAADLVRQLEMQVDSYRMAIGQLLRRPRFDLDDGGKVKLMPPGLAAACESRRRKIRDLVAQLVDPRQAPLFDDAVEFQAAEGPAEQNSIIHRMTPSVHRLAELVHKQGKPLPTDWPANAFCFNLIRLSLERESHVPARTDRGPTVDFASRWRTSEWDFDRIMYALYLEKSIELSPDPNPLCQAGLEMAEDELEKARSQPAALVSLIPLRHVLSPLRNLHMARHPLDLERIGQLVKDVNEFVNTPGTVQDQAMRAALAEIDRRLKAVKPPAPAAAGGVTMTAPS